MTNRPEIDATLLKRLLDTEDEGVLICGLELLASMEGVLKKVVCSVPLDRRIDA